MDAQPVSPLTRKRHTIAGISGFGFGSGSNSSTHKDGRRAIMLLHPHPLVNRSLLRAGYADTI